MFRFSDAAALALALIFAAFFLLPATRQVYETAYAAIPLIISFIKFAVLATAGEMLAGRVRRGGPGRYLPEGFGLLPKMVVWGFIGVLIYWIFGIFSAGVQSAFPGAFAAGIFGLPVAGAFLISLFMNLFFAPVMMIFHHLSDRFIAAHAGRFPLRNWNTRELLEATDWKRMWGFVFARTIPLFWIPAHTVTFLLPDTYRTLFAALLSVALGLLLAFAAPRSGDKITGDQP